MLKLTNPYEGEVAAKELVEQVFGQLDQKKNGVVYEDDFVKAVTIDQALLDVLLCRTEGQPRY